MLPIQIKTLTNCDEYNIAKVNGTYLSQDEEGVSHLPESSG